MNNIFGYVVVNMDKLSVAEKKHYLACYCGLCKVLGKRHGIISRSTLSYEMAFLTLFLSAIYEADNTLETGRCLFHPFKTHEYWYNKITYYAADMNVLLAYYKFLDDWADERKILAFCGAKLFEQKYQQIAAQYPEQCATVSQCLSELAQIEKSGELNPDIPANCFGKLLGKIIVFCENEYAANLRAFGRAFGKFIYIMDACLDFEKDIKNERYNPLVATSSKNFYDILNLLMADCIEKYKQLPIKQDNELIENILYSGVWTRYEVKKEKAKAKGKHTR